MTKKKSLIYYIYDELVAAVDGIAKKTFLERPKVTDKELEYFIVVDIPTEIRGQVKGSLNFRVDCYATYSIFCKSKTDGTLNIGAQTALTQKVIDKFPINGKFITATKPTVLMEGNDGFGYHVTQVSFKLRTKLNALNQNS